MGSKGGTSVEQRPLTAEELKLFEAQTESLDMATDIASKQFNLSKEDRAYFDKIYRGEADPNSPEVQKEVANRLKNTPKPTLEQYTEYVKTANEAQLNMYVLKELRPKYIGYDVGDISESAEAKDPKFRDEVARKYGISTDGKKVDRESYEKAMTEWEETKNSIVKTVSQELGTKGVDEILFDAIKQSPTVMGEAFSNWETQARQLGKEYTDTLGNIGKSMGTADADIYAQTKGQNLAGISQAYQEAQKQALGTLSRRGLAGSGVEAGVIGTLAGQQAQQSGIAMSKSYMDAIGLSDARRQQQLGISGQLYQTNLNTETSVLQNTLNAQQQNIANLAQASGISQGVYTGAQNYLQQAGSTANQSASVAGQTAIGIGSNSSVVTQDGTSGLAGALGGVAGLLTGGAKMYSAVNSSDFRFKNNIKFVKEVNGIRLYTWEWNEFAKSYSNNLYEPYGVIAQEILATHPEYVFKDENGYYFVDYSGLNEDFNLGV